MLKDVTPFIPVADLDRALAFYHDVLGFDAARAYIMPGIYAYIKRDQVALRLVQVHAEMDLTHPMKEQSCYIDVEDVDALYVELKPALDKLPEGRVRAPFNQDYNQRELHVIDEDCTLIFFGMPVPKVN